MCVCVLCVCELPTHHYSWTTVSLHKINVMKPPEECRLQSQTMTAKREIELERERSGARKRRRVEKKEEIKNTRKKSNGREVM